VAVEWIRRLLALNALPASKLIDVRAKLERIKECVLRHRAPYKREQADHSLMVESEKSSSEGASIGSPQEKELSLRASSKRHLCDALRAKGFPNLSDEKLLHVASQFEQDSWARHADKAAYVDVINAKLGELGAPVMRWKEETEESEDVVCDKVVAVTNRLVSLEATLKQKKHDALPKKEKVALLAQYAKQEQTVLACKKEYDQGLGVYVAAIANGSESSSAKDDWCQKQVALNAAVENLAELKAKLVSLGLASAEDAQRILGEAVVEKAERTSLRAEIRDLQAQITHAQALYPQGVYWVCKLIRSEIK
jgi:5'-3' exonuclease